jgi:hypothetical protein
VNRHTTLFRDERIFDCEHVIFERDTDSLSKAAIVQAGKGGKQIILNHMSKDQRTHVILD